MQRKALKLCGTFGLIFLAGCATPQERAERAVAVFSPACEAYGFQRGTADFAACIQRAQAEDYNRRAAAAAAIQRATQPAPPMNCTSTRDAFGAVHTTCR